MRRHTRCTSRSHRNAFAAAPSVGVPARGSLRIPARLSLPGRIFLEDAQGQLRGGLKGAGRKPESSNSDWSVNERRETWSPTANSGARRVAGRRSTTNPYSGCWFDMPMQMFKWPAAPRGQSLPSSAGTCACRWPGVPCGPCAAQHIPAQRAFACIEERTRRAGGVARRATAISKHWTRTIIGSAGMALED